MIYRLKLPNQVETKVDAIVFDPDPMGGKIVSKQKITNVVGVSAVRDLYTVWVEGAICILQ